MRSPSASIFMRGHELDIYALDYSNDGRIVVSGSGDRTAKIWAGVHTQ